MRPTMTLSGWRILVVEDDLDSLAFMQDLIESYGATAYTAQHGQEGLEQARLHKPMLIIADLSMPVMDGWELLTELRQDPSTASIPVIALTAHAMVGDREKALQAGFDNHLSKPLRADKFLSQIEWLLANIPDLANQLFTNRLP